MYKLKRISLMILSLLSTYREQICLLNTRKDFSEPLPIIIKDDKLLEPTDNHGNILMRHGDILKLSCDGSGFITHPYATKQVTCAVLFCKSGDMFVNHEWLDSPAFFHGFTCSRHPHLRDYTSRTTSRECYGGSSIIEVGYLVEDQFYPVYESCFNYQELAVIYSTYTQKPYNMFYQTKVSRPFFIGDNHFGHLPLDDIFSPTGQKVAVANLIGDKVNEYVTASQFLSRGHLAAMTDFVFAFGERATFHYVNCAPQWTGFNGGNWNTLEIDLRNHVHAFSLDTIIYTGVFGVTTLRDDNDASVEIYLYTDRFGNQSIPVPLYFYKVVYEPSTKRGTAFIGVNNPYYTKSDLVKLTFCSNICRNNPKFYWLTWHYDSPKKGYTFCCTIPDFRKTIHHLPYLDVEGILY